MNDCLHLPLVQGIGGVRPLHNWECVWMPLGEGEAEGLPRGAGDGWQPVPVPGQLAATRERQAVWYRCEFRKPEHSGRVLLRVGGAFLAANVWLNGRLLGSHYGYFGAFGFDVTPFLTAANLLVICCESPIEENPSRKRHLTGIFGDGDSRPYPPSAFLSLPPRYRWEMPLGLWSEVGLEYVGPVTIDWIRLDPAMEAGVGRLAAEIRVRNLDGREMAGELSLTVEGPGLPPTRLLRDYRVQGGLERTVAMSVSIPGARRWWPWRLGEQPVYRCVVELRHENRVSARAEESFGFRELDIGVGPDGWRVVVNGRKLFLRGANYMPAQRLDALTPALFAADLELARQANLDAVRVHGHVLPSSFYRLADEKGMLVLADMPLTYAYGYHAADDEARFFEQAVREQIREMVDTLRNRPSVAMWIAHDDPPWIGGNADLGDVHTVRQNYNVDQEAKGLFERLDPSRPALAASGQYDTHAFPGWRGGSWTEFSEVTGGLVTEFGAQALPSFESKVWQELGWRWPVEDDHPDWLFAGYQSNAWMECGVGPPSWHERLTDYVQASQEYQAWLIRYAVDQLRKRKFSPCWGAFAYHLVDSFNGIGFGMVDHARTPRLAYLALKEAMAATRIVIDPVGFRPVHPWGVGYAPHQNAQIRLVVVNDDPRLAGEGRLRWTFTRDQAPEKGAMGWVMDQLRRRAFAGYVDFPIPTIDDPAIMVEILDLPIGAEGVYRLSVEMLADSRPVTRTELPIFAGTHLGRRPRAVVPRYLAERLLVAGSLRAELDGFSFEIRNRTRPAVLTGLRGFRLNGQRVAESDADAVYLEGRASLPRRLNLPLDRAFRVYVDTGFIPMADRLELEFELTVPGVACGLVTLDGGSRATSPVET